MPKVKKPKIYQPYQIKSEKITFQKIVLIIVTVVVLISFLLPAVFSLMR